MPLLPVHGHEQLRRRLRDAHARGALPASLLLHGPRGIGKQRLALWLGQLLLCSADGERPCGECRACAYALALTHPDLRWFFAHKRSEDADPQATEILDEFAERAAERAERAGLYAPPPGTEGIFVSDVRALVHFAAVTPALAKRKVIVVGDADTMVRRSADEASNAFLKLLEEPPADTTIVLTSSEPGELLPTIRSRVVAYRVAPLGERDVRAWLAQPEVASRLAELEVPAGDVARVELAGGAPGALLASDARAEAATNARRILDAARGDRAARMRTALALGGSKARGAFTDALDALTALLHQSARDALAHGDPHAAAAAGRAIDAVQSAREHAAGNVNPQLLGARLMRLLAQELA